MKIISFFFLFIVTFSTSLNCCASSSIVTNSIEQVDDCSTDCTAEHQADASKDECQCVCSCSLKLIIVKAFPTAFRDMVMKSVFPALMGLIESDFAEYIFHPPINLSIV